MYAPISNSAIEVAEGKVVEFPHLLNINEFVTNLKCHASEVTIGVLFGASMFSSRPLITGSSHFET